MSDFTKMFEQMMQQGQDMAKKMQMDAPAVNMPGMDAFRDMMPDFAKSAMDTMTGDGLDMKARSLATLAGMTALGAENTAKVSLAVKSCLQAGASKREITETILQMSMIAAVTGVPNALTAANAVFATEGAAE